MKTATVAAAAAGLIGTAMADGWDNWSSTAADPAKTSTAWESWTSSTAKDPETATSSWSEWSASSTAKDPKTTAAETWSEWSASSTAKDPETTAETWSEWSTSSTAKDPEDTATWSEWSASSTAKDPETASSWSEWSASSTAKDPETTAETWSEWSASSTAKDPETTSWAEWSASSTAKDPETTESWGAWTDGVTTTVMSTTTYVTVTVYPVSTSASETWSEWSTSTVDAVTSSSTAAAVDTETWSAWDPATAQCAIQVSTSYGVPTWNPTPVVEPTASASETWADWSSTSTVSAEPTTSTWAAWSADPTTSTWADWSASSTVSAEPTTSTWAAWSADPTTSTWAAWSADPTTSTWAAWSSGSDSATATTSSWSSWSTGSSSSGSGSLSANGNKLGITYSPYTANGGCKDAGTVAADIAEIAGLGFATVRVYSTDCNTLENVGSAAKSNGIKVILGVFISNTGISGAQPQVEAIVSWAQWDLVDVIVVGNEAIFNNYCSASELAGFISSSKTAFAAAGYKGLVTTTEELSVWQSSGSELCDVIDITAANLYAFFNADTTADQAGSFIQAEIAELEAICPGKDVYAMECGWPSAGECNGAACPSPENQKTALTSIQQITGAKIVFFSFEDEQWKQPGQFGVEQHWGCKDVF